MHPILFRIPLPRHTVPLTWLLLAAAVLALLFALPAALKRRWADAALPLGLAAVGAVAAVVLRGQTWDMAPVPIYSYGVMLGLSLVVGWYLSLTLAERDGLPKETMANNYVVTAVAAIIGSRVLYVLTNLDEFDSLGSMFAMRRGGLVAYGGFLGGLLGSYVYLKRHKIPLLPWGDVAVPSLASGLFITRIGCYLFGCDFGHPLKDTAPGWLKSMGSFPKWAEGTLDHGVGSPAWVQHVRERGLSASAETSLPVHPTQIYESLVGLALLIGLLLARKHQKFRGQVFLLFFYGYGVCRFLLEILRDDAERGSLPPSLPEHILLPLGLVVLGAAFAFGFAQAIVAKPARLTAQIGAFVPAVALFFALRPGDGFPVIAQFSTSQFIALASAALAAVAYAVLHRAAVAHPEDAMALNLPPAEEEEGEAEEAPAATTKPAAPEESVTAPTWHDAASDEPAAAPEAATAATDGAGTESAKPEETP